MDSLESKNIYTFHQLCNLKSQQRYNFIPMQIKLKNIKYKKKKTQLN